MIKNFEIADDGNDNPELNRNPKILNQTRPRVYKVAGTLIFFPIRRGTLISFPNPNLAPRPLNIGKSYILKGNIGAKL